MSQKRKVNAPVPVRRPSKVKAPGNRHRLESEGPARGTGQFVGIAAAVVALGAVVVIGTLLPRWLPQKPKPWEDYRERMVEERELSIANGRQIYVYQYRPRELDKWLTGVRDPGLSPSDLLLITNRAVELLPPVVAGEILVAAARAHPGQRESLQAGIAAVGAKLPTNTPEGREIKGRLDAAMKATP